MTVIFGIKAGCGMKVVWGMKFNCRMKLVCGLTVICVIKLINFMAVCLFTKFCLSSSKWFVVCDLFVVTLHFSLYISN